MKTANFLLCLIPVAIISVTGSPVDDGDGRIVGGRLINNSQAPYIVRVIYDSPGKRSFCGGTLVAPNVVVTAAHCVYGKIESGFTVVAGVTKTDEEGIRSTVSTISVHKDYKNYTMHSDVALLQTSRHFLNIPRLDLCNKALMDHDRVDVSGWGSEADGQQGTYHLKMVQLPVRSRDICLKEYHRFVEKNMFCASGYEPISSCRGDSGGPAVFNNQLCGIVAFSFKCGEVGSTDVYTDVFSVKSFIEDAMKSPWKYPNTY